MSGQDRGTGVAWGVGDLSNAPDGALTTIFDVNFMQNQWDLPNSQNLTKNLIGFVHGDAVTQRGIRQVAVVGHELVTGGPLGEGDDRRAGEVVGLTEAGSPH